MSFYSMLVLFLFKVMNSTDVSVKSRVEINNKTQMPSIVH